MKLKQLILSSAVVLAIGSVDAAAAPAGAQLPDFMYQGKLDQNDNPANGNFDLTFSLWDAAVGGSQIGDTISESGYPVLHGLFSINLAFDGAFTGDQTWLEVSVNGTILPRQAIATSPVAQFALDGNAGPAGPQGPQGPAGPVGAEGQQGPAGDTGATGPQGPIGATGETGAPGPQGAVGPTGVQGPVGETGPTGAVGATGETGAIGPAGATGATGAQGAIGATGPAGAIGPMGPQGATGAQGAPGAQGPAGAQGVTGAQGPAGAQGATGAQGPAGAQGAQGPVGPAGGGKYQVSINGTLSTSLARPLHPVSAGGYGVNVILMSTQGYLLSIEADGGMAGASSGYFTSTDCSGPALVFNNVARPGNLVALGNAQSLYYVPKTGATVLMDPTRNSRSTSSIACEPNVNVMVGPYYLAQPNNPAVTGIDPMATPVTVSVDYVP